MQKDVWNIKKELEYLLKERGFSYRERSNDIFEIVSHKNVLMEVTAKLIISDQVDPLFHGTKNGTEIKAIGCFSFEQLNGKEFDYYILAFSNKADNCLEFAILPFSELKHRLESRSQIIAPGNDKIELELWLLPDDFLFETTNLGAEGEWWLIGGRMAINTHRDYTCYRNAWNQLK